MKHGSDTAAKLVQTKARLKNASRELENLKSKVKDKSEEGKKRSSRPQSKSTSIINSGSWEDVDISYFVGLLIQKLLIIPYTWTSSRGSNCFGVCRQFCTCIQKTTTTICILTYLIRS